MKNLPISSSYKLNNERYENSFLNPYKRQEMVLGNSAIQPEINKMNKIFDYNELKSPKFIN